MAAWAFLGVVLIAHVATMVSIFPGTDELLNERFTPLIQKGQPLADKTLVLLLIATLFGLLVLIPPFSKTTFGWRQNR